MHRGHTLRSSSRARWRAVTVRATSRDAILARPCSNSAGPWPCLIANPWFSIGSSRGGRWPRASPALRDRAGTPLSRAAQASPPSLGSPARASTAPDAAAGVRCGVEPKRLLVNASLSKARRPHELAAQVALPPVQASTIMRSPRGENRDRHETRGRPPRPARRRSASKGTSAQIVSLAA